MSNRKRLKETEYFQIDEPTVKTKGKKVTLKQGPVTKKDLENAALSKAPRVNKDGITVLPTHTERPNSSKKVSYQVVLGDNQAGDTFVGKAMANRYLSHNLPYYGSATIIVQKKTPNGLKVGQSIKNKVPGKLSEYNKFTARMWEEHEDLKAGYYDNDLGGASRLIASLWPEEKKKTGFVPKSQQPKEKKMKEPKAPKESTPKVGVPKGTHLRYANVTGKSDWKSLTDQQKRDWAQANPPKAKTNPPPKSSKTPSRYAKKK
jgi:hypothetical protein